MFVIHKLRCNVCGRVNSITKYIGKNYQATYIVIVTEIRRWFLHIFPVEVDVVDLWFERNVKRQCIVVNDALSDVIQFTRNACKHIK